MNKANDILIVKNGDEVQVELGSVLSDETQLPDLTRFSKIRMDLKNLKHVNSIGIKTWCQWVKRHNQIQAIEIENCPYIFARSFSVVVGVVTANMIVKSMFVPFFSEQTSERKDVLLSNGIHFGEQGVKVLPNPNDELGHSMNPDFVVDKFFRFLVK